MGSTWEEVSNTIVVAEAVGGFAGIAYQYGKKFILACPALAT
jgi:hypothetical protein